MKPLLALAALAAAVVLLRRRTETIYQSITPDADDSEVVGMPTTWSESYPQTANATTWTTRRVMMFAPHQPQLGDAMDLVARRPVLTVGVIVTAIAAVIGATNAFGLTTITPEQGEALTKAVVAMWPLLLVIQQLVTPAAAPKLPEGQDVRLPDGTSGTVVRK